MKKAVECGRTLDRGNGKPILICDRIAGHSDPHVTPDSVPFRQSAVEAREASRRQ